jgi:hypothetical protein
MYAPTGIVRVVFQPSAVQSGLRNGIFSETSGEQAREIGIQSLSAAESLSGNQKAIVV